MVRLKDTPTKNELEGSIEKASLEMKEKGEDLDKIASDAETVKNTLENLDLGGTSEGAEKLKTSFESTERVTKEVFDGKDDELEKIHADNREFEHETEGRRESSETDQHKISDAADAMTTHESINELLKAKEAVLEDIDFLKEQIERAHEAMTKSEAIQEKHRGRMQM